MRALPRFLPVTALLAALLVLNACERPTDQREPAPTNKDPLVFGDNFGDGATYEAFLFSKLDAVDVDHTTVFDGDASLVVTVPGPGATDGGFAGGAFTTNLARDFSVYDALTFYAKASMPAVLDVVGIGNDNTGTSLYEASWDGVPLTQDWQRIVVPIPRPDRLTNERGLFFFAEGPENGQGYTIWFDEIRYANTGEVLDPRPTMPTRTLDLFVGAEIEIDGAQVTFSVAGRDVVMNVSQYYFDFSSSNDSVVTTVDGRLRVVGAGTATITASLGPVAATGTIEVRASAPPSEPAPVPTYPAADVISLFSNAYDDVPVDTWSATWDRADLTETQIAGDDVKAYTGLVFAGIEFTQPVIDASAMTHVRLDVWVPQGTTLRVKLVDFGEDGTFGGAPDSEFELGFNASTDPALVTGQWVTLDIPFSSFLGLTARNHLAQLILSGDTPTLYLDNVLFHR